MDTCRVRVEENVGSLLNYEKESSLLFKEYELQTRPGSARL
jgi:hypothetical protein